MPTGSFLQVNVTCPFYISDDGKNRIICEGIVPDSRDHVSFRQSKSFRCQIEVYCCDQYTKCERYHPIMEKYRDDGFGD